MVQVLYLLEVFILAHYGPPSTETPTITIVWCHKNSWIYLTNTFLLLVTFETNDSYLIQFEMKKTLFAQLYTWHKRSRPALTPASKLVHDLSTPDWPGGMEGWVDLGYLAMHRPGVELAIAKVRSPNHYTTEPPTLLCFLCFCPVSVSVCASVCACFPNIVSTQYLDHLFSTFFGLWPPAKPLTLKLLTYCVLRPTQPPTLSGTGNE